ncbi:hypothetical protein M8J76_003719 [Diaphorina citri]|nr:hypothetical protein M8J75_013172 [Diaphorina citri]KAI5744602.1 hypothetical protein M8J76_003719 [Diaphorina citri]
MLIRIDNSTNVFSNKIRITHNSQFNGYEFNFYEDRLLLKASATLTAITDILVVRLTIAVEMERWYKHVEHAIETDMDFTQLSHGTELAPLQRKGIPRNSKSSVEILPHNSDFRTHTTLTEHSQRGIPETPFAPLKTTPSRFSKTFNEGRETGDDKSESNIRVVEVYGDVQ